MKINLEIYDRKKFLNRKKLVTHILETHVGPVESILEAMKNKKNHGIH